MALLVTHNLIPELSINRTAAQVYEFEIKDSSGKAVDLTGATATFEVYKDIEGSNGSTIINKSITVTESIKGMCYVQILSTDVGIDTGKYIYIINFDYGSDNIDKYGTGVFTVIGDDTTRIAEIKKTYGFNFEYYILQKAFEYARENIVRKAFIEKKVTFRQANTQFLLDNYLADSDFDGQLTVSDISLREYQDKTPYGINELSTQISSIVPDHPNGNIIVNLSGSYPSDSTYTLEFTYFKIAEPYSTIKKSINRLEELYVIQYLFNTLEPYKLQNGLTKKELNGVIIEFNQKAIEEYLNRINNEIIRELIKCKPWENESVQISKRY